MSTAASEHRADRLAALKAFYLGRAIAVSANRELALTRIENGLAILRARRKVEDALREIFYTLLLAEVYRGKDVALSHRLEAQRLSLALPSKAYDFYMKIVDATQGRQKTSGIGGEGVVVPGEIANHHISALSDGYSWPGLLSGDLAKNAVGWDDSHLTRGERRFLEDATLKDLMSAHGLW